MKTIERPLKCGHQEIMLRTIHPDTDEEKKEFQQILGAAYTEMAVSIIKRKFTDPTDRKALYQVLLDLKASGAII